MVVRFRQAARGVCGILVMHPAGRLVMGKFTYEGDQKVEIEDRALTHVQLVITAKLRRGEPFPFTWREDVSIGGGRTTVWIHPGSNLVFKYYGSRTPPVNRAWIDALAFTANSPAGLFVVSEPAEGTRAEEDLAPALT
ncbi:hypothetical protein HDC31_002863 [Microbacterium sp. JAI119]|nr:hypothetical protein [Microbacterium sp. JAI119]